MKIILLNFCQNKQIEFEYLEETIKITKDRKAFINEMLD